MANSSMSVKQCVVSYLEVYQNWVRNDRDRNNGQSTIPINEIARKLTLSMLLKKPEYQTVNRQKTDEDKLVKLFYDFMPGKSEEGFKQVVDYLLDNEYINLANDLLSQMQKCLAFHDGTKVEQNQTDTDVHETTLPVSNPMPMHRSFNIRMKVENPLMVEAQKHLSTFLINNVDYMAEIWSGLIHLPRTYSAFVDVQVLENFKDDKGKVVHEYEEVFNNVTKNQEFKRILIQGDPGCGKSTYVNKIALDWANKHEYLQDKFDLVFLIALQTFDVSIKQAICALLPERSIKFVEEYYKSHSSKVLLILDGFDELPEDSQFYKEVINMMNGRLSQFQFFTTVVTTRRSHVDKVPQRYHERSLLIKGFDEQSMKLFLQRQDVPIPDEQTDSNLVVLLQNPLFCTIYCSLHFGGIDKSKLKDPYDFIKALVDNAVKKEKKTKEAESEEEQLKLLGAFAFQKLNSETLNVVDKMFSTFLSRLIHFFKKKPDHAQTIDPDKIQLGLLIKKKIPVAGGGYTEEFDFPHQLVAEYLAARYFIRHSLTESQQKQLQPEKLADPKHSNVVRKLILSSPSSLPFIRFLLFEYVTSNFRDDESGRESIFEFLSDEFRFICYCKSNSETPTINDITTLVCQNIDRDIRQDSRFFPTLVKCNQLKSLNFRFCELLTNEVSELVELFQENHLPKLTWLDLSNNSNVGSTPALFSALGKCKLLEVLELPSCFLSVESTKRLVTCIDNNSWTNLARLNLSGNENFVFVDELFRVLHKCLHLRDLYLSKCSLTYQSMKIFLSTFNSNTFQDLQVFDLSANFTLEIDDNFYLSLLTCSKLSRIYFKEFYDFFDSDLSPIERELSSSGQQAKQVLLDRGCEIIK